jgi:hypothetical protein
MDLTPVSIQTTQGQGEIGTRCVSPWNFGLNQGADILTIENFHSVLIWNGVRKCWHFVEGLCRASFRGGSLAAENLQAGGHALERLEFRRDPRSPQ